MADVWTIPAYDLDHQWAQHACADCSECTYFNCKVHDRCRCAQ